MMHMCFYVVITVCSSTVWVVFDVFSPCRKFNHICEQTRFKNWALEDTHKAVTEHRRQQNYVFFLKKNIIYKYFKGIFKSSPFTVPALEFLVRHSGVYGFSLQWHTQHMHTICPSNIRGLHTRTHCAPVTWEANTHTHTLCPNNPRGLHIHINTHTLTK